MFCRNGCTNKFLMPAKELVQPHVLKLVVGDKQCSVGMAAPTNFLCQPMFRLSLGLP